MLSLSQWFNTRPVRTHWDSILSASGQRLGDLILKKAWNQSQQGFIFANLGYSKTQILPLSSLVIPSHEKYPCTEPLSYYIP